VLFFEIITLDNIVTSFQNSTFHRVLTFERAVIQINESPEFIFERISKVEKLNSERVSAEKKNELHSESEI